MDHHNSTTENNHTYNLVSMSNGTATSGGTDGSVHTEIVDMQQILPATTEKLLMEEEEEKREKGSEGSQGSQTSRTSARLLEKIVFVISISTLVFLAMCVIQLHWLLPYHYSISMPILITVRVIMYWKSKQQYFMLDFCYFGNALCFLYIWAFPMNSIMSCIIFAVSTGPMAWATCLFRNSLVFHSVDKMTSIYIHVLPAYLMYSIRWYPESTSLHWYTSFVSDFDLSLWEMFVWLFGLGFLCFVLHSVIYTVVVYVLLRPSPDYLNSYRYLSAREDSCVGKLINIFGPKLRFATYIGWNWIYCILSLLVVLGCYQFFIFHTVLIAVVTFVITWNGAGYYMDVFSIKGFGFDD